MVVDNHEGRLGPDSEVWCLILYGSNSMHNGESSTLIIKEINFVFRKTILGVM